jgi:phospholipase/lecithinase/hemolysin
MARIGTLNLAAAFFLWFCTMAMAGPFTALWIFGDSTVDTGWYRTDPSGKANYDHYMQQSALGVGKPTSSPGRVSVEVLADALGLTAVPQNQAGGTNYATGGAKNVRHNLPNNDGFTNAVPTVQQIKNYLANNTATSTALYLVSSGDNDVAFVLKHHGANAKTYLSEAANSLALEIDALTKHGNDAKHIVVVDLPQSFGSGAKKSFRAFYNQTLKAKLTALHVPFLWADVNAARKLMESFKNQTSSPFGITNYKLGSTSCPACASCPVPTPDPNVTPAITTDWAYVCSTAAQAPSMPSNDQASEWADNGHYATGGQSVFGSFFFCAAKKKWSTLNWPANPNLLFDCKQFSSLL